MIKIRTKQKKGNMKITISFPWKKSTERMIRRILTALIAAALLAVLKGDSAQSQSKIKFRHPIEWNLVVSSRMIR
jgi:hypothetical protein